MKPKQTYPIFASCNPTLCITSNMMKMNRIIASVFRKHLSPFNITNSQLSMLFVIGKMIEVNQKRIAEFMFLEKSTVNRNLKHLVRNGHIERTGGFKYKMTKDGHELLEKIIPHWNNAMNEMKTLLGSEGTNALDILTKNLIYK